jgi:hypothetical protein
MLEQRPRQIAFFQWPLEAFYEDYNHAHTKIIPKETTHTLNPRPKLLSKVRVRLTPRGCVGGSPIDWRRICWRERGYPFARANG